MNSKLQLRYGGGGGCEKQRSPLPSSPSSLPLLLAAPRWISICTDKWKQTRARCVFRCQIHFQWRLGSGWNYVTIARNNWERRQKWRYTEIIIITLKDLQWQRDESQQGLCVVAGQIVPSIDCAEDKKTTASEHVSNLGISVAKRLIKSVSGLGHLSRWSADGRFIFLKGNTKRICLTLEQHPDILFYSLLLVSLKLK